MSQRNGDRSRFQINRKRKIRHRQRLRALLTAGAEQQKGSVVTSAGKPASKPRE